MTDYSFDISQNCVRVELTEELVALPFSCGDDDLDDFFHNHALLYGKEHLGKTYVFINNDTSQIVAFFTVSNDSIKTTFIPKNSTNRVQRKIPGLKHLRTYPAVLIGRLGVSKSYQGKDFMIGRQIVNFIKLKRSSCWPGGTEGQYEDRVVRQEDISMGINPALDYLSMPSSVEIKAGAATAN